VGPVLPRDNGAGWKKRTVIPSLQGVPVQTIAAGLAFVVSVLLLGVVVYLGSRVDRLRDQQAKLQTRIAMLDARPPGDPAAVQDLSTRLEASVVRIAALEAAPRTDPDVLAALGTRVAALSDRADALEARPSGDPATVQGLVAGLDVSAARIAALEAAPRADPELLASVDARVTALSDRTNALEARPPGDPAALERLAAGLDASASRIAALEAAPRTDPEALASVDARVAALSDRTGALEARPPGDPAALDLLTAGLEATSGRIAALEALPRSDPAAIESLGNGLAELSGRVSELETARATETVSEGASTAEPTAGTVRASGTPMEGSWAVLGEIHFASGGFSLGPAALDAVSSIAEVAIRTNRRIVIRGYADRVGNPVFNQALSLRRAIAVQLALIDQSVPTWQFHSVDGYGEDALPIRTDDERPEPGNRVVIVFGGTGPIALSSAAPD